MDVKGKVAFVTGGASGIGLGMARAFVRAGMTVMIADVREDHLASALSSFSNSEKVRGLKLDVTDRSAMARAVEETLRAFGKVHVLCNNAGVGLAGPMKLATYADWDWVMGVNLGGVINGVVAFLPHMLAQREGGHIVNTCSMSGILPHAGAGIYTTSKAAVIGMSEVLRTELAEENIGVSAFCPGACANEDCTERQDAPGAPCGDGLRRVRQGARRTLRLSPLYGAATGRRARARGRAPQRAFHLHALGISRRRARALRSDHGRHPESSREPRI